MSILQGIKKTIYKKLVDQKYEEVSKLLTTDHIKYDWDAGHCYSYIDHPVYDFDDDIALDACHKWLYENDDCPPCAIHVNEDGTGSSGCGCHDGRAEDDVLDMISQLEDYAREHKYNIKYLVSYWDNRVVTLQVLLKVGRVNSPLSLPLYTRETTTDL